MAVKPISHIEDNPKDPGFKVEGDLGDLQISLPSDGEETEQDTEICSRNFDSVSNFPSSLVENSHVPIYGNVAVANSSNVQLGNNTHFHGPVVIKQIIQRKSGIENESYTNTEEDTVPTEGHRHTAKTRVTLTEKYHTQPWHKVVITATCVIVVAVVFTIVFLLQGKTSKSQNSSSNEEPDSSSTVVGLWYDYVALVTFAIVLVVLTMQLMLYPLLIPQTNDVDEKNKHHTSQIFIPDTSQFADNRIMRVAPKGNILIAPHHLRIVSRTDWLAQPPDHSEMTKLRQPVPWVIITHTATESCHSQTECVLRVRLIQTYHIESRNWDDIAYNFLVGGDGSAYYGRGWDIQGAHTLGYNKYSIGIAFIGTFNSENPPDKQVEACKKLLKLGVQLGKLSKDYKLFAHRQLSSTLSPGDKIFNIIKTWPHFVNDTSDVESLVPPY